MMSNNAEQRKIRALSAQVRQSGRGQARHSTCTTDNMLTRESALHRHRMGLLQGRLSLIAPLLATQIKSCNGSTAG